MDFSIENMSKYPQILTLKIQIEPQTKSHSDFYIRVLQATVEQIQSSINRIGGVRSYDTEINETFNKE